MILGSFWASFWPTFAATIVGVVGGIPTGLWLNRRAERSAADRRSATERAQTREALVQLEPIIRGHKRCGSRDLNEYYDGPLSELWVVLRTQIVASHLTDGRLYGDLAVHFERCVRLDDLIRMRSSLTVAGPPPGYEDLTRNLEAIETRLLNISRADGAAPDSIADRVRAEIDLLHHPRT